MPPRARRAPSESWRSSITRGGRGPRNGPPHPNARRAPRNPARPSISAARGGDRRRLVERRGPLGVARGGRARGFYVFGAERLCEGGCLAVLLRGFFYRRG